MAEVHELTCIGCPMGCQIEVKTVDGTVATITGFACKKGEQYAAKEITDPRRTITSILPVAGGVIAMVPVKTATEIPKRKIAEAMQAIKSLVVQAPIAAGDVIVADLCGTGVNLVATRAVPRRD